MGRRTLKDGTFMENILQSIQRRWIGRSKRDAQVKLERTPNAAHEGQLEIPAFDIAPHDPIMAYFLSIPEAIEVDKLNLDSPALKALQARGVKMVVPMAMKPMIAACRFCPGTLYTLP